MLDVEQAECGCPAGKGPFASCKHVAALCYALEEFSHFGRVPEFLTSAEKLQEWNQPQPKKLEIIPVAELSQGELKSSKKRMTISCYMGRMIHDHLSIAQVIMLHLKNFVANYKALINILLF